MLLYIKIFPAVILPAFITATMVCKVTSKSNLGKAEVYFSIIGLISAGLFRPRFLQSQFEICPRSAQRQELQLDPLRSPRTIVNPINRETTTAM